MVELVLDYNRRAMLELTQGHLKAAMRDLNYALSSAATIPDTSQRPRLLLICYNNIACYYKKTQNLTRALQYLSRATELDGDSCNVANVHLNITGILSDQGEHERALRHAFKAVCILKKHFEGTDDFVSLLVLAYQSLGTQYEYLNLHAEARDCFKKGISLGTENLGASNKIVKELRLRVGPRKRRTFSKHVKAASPKKSKIHNAVIKAKKEAAATILQSWWRGVSLRKKLLVGSLDKQILKAKEKMGRARLKIERLKNKRLILIGKLT